MKAVFVYLILSIFALNVQADGRDSKPLTVSFNNCTEFVGVASVDEARARALVPVDYQLVTDEAGAKLVVRISNCQGIAVNHQRSQPGTVAHIGMMIYSPDGTATDPNTSINNYTLSYVSNDADLVKALSKQDISARLDTDLAYEVTPVNGLSEFYVLVSPDAVKAADWSLYGSVKEPQIPSEFLANWWQASRKGEVKMATTIPLIYFDFSSEVSFFTSRQNPIGALLGSNRIASFPLSFRGQFATAEMLVSRSH
jgi:hypothetical protein